jgi:hypothetical protein
MKAKREAPAPKTITAAELQGGEPLANALALLVRHVNAVGFGDHVASFIRSHKPTFSPRDLRKLGAALCDLAQIWEAPGRSMTTLFGSTDFAPASPEKVAALVRLLGSNHDFEALAAARGLQRILGSTGICDLGDVIERHWSPPISVKPDPHRSGIRRRDGRNGRFAPSNSWRIPRSWSPNTPTSSTS